MPDIQMTMKPELIMRAGGPYLYVEKVGPFMKTAPTAWPEFWQTARGKIDLANVAVMAGLSKIDEAKDGDEKYTYQAGVFLKNAVTQVPEGLRLREVATGRYARFLLTGSYAQLPEAYPLAFTILAEGPLKLRPDFNIEAYLNTPETVPEAQLQTEILIPIMSAGG